MAQPNEGIHERVLHYFREISKIPRGSGKEAKIAEYLLDFAESRKLPCKRSSAVINGKQTYDLVITKEASPGYAGLETVILQAHTDMVCQKVKNSNHNFETDPIKIVEQHGKMTADGTTLGADDGIGVACMLAILESDSIAHPKLEALFTSDEEDGMTGAMAVTQDLVSGRRLINIDTESEGTLYYGCAGGMDANFVLPVSHTPVPEGWALLKIELSGLLGGHSGVEIHKKHANAHKLTARTLNELQANDNSMLLVRFEGGNKRNVITREAGALIAVKPDSVSDVIKRVEKLQEIFRHEYEGVETDINLKVGPSDEHAAQALSPESFNCFLTALLVIPNDIQAMHCKVEGLVETSCNLGIVRQDADSFYLCSLIRSFTRTKKLYVAEQMRRLAALLGAKFEASHDYPDWEPNPASELIARFVHAYKGLFGKEPELASIHAGLECGYFTEKFPYMDMIACGPTITGAHTPEEALDVDSTQKVVDLLVAVLEQMKAPPPVMDRCCGGHTPDVKGITVCQCIR